MEYLNHICPRQHSSVQGQGLLQPVFICSLSHLLHAMSRKVFIRIMPPLSEILLRNYFQSEFYQVHLISDFIEMVYFYKPFYFSIFIWMKLLSSHQSNPSVHFFFFFFGPHKILLTMHLLLLQRFSHPGPLYLLSLIFLNQI